MLSTFSANQDWFSMIIDQVTKKGRTGQLVEPIETERNVISYIVMMTIEN